MEYWLAYNDPYFTDQEPYCNTIRVISAKDAVLYWRRTHQGKGYEYLSDLDVLEEFRWVNYAWYVDEPLGLAGRTAKEDN